MRISDRSSDVCSSDLIRLSGEGEAGSRGGPAGDLYIFIHLKQHALFERNGTTLLARAPVSFTTAALGGTIEVPGIDRKPCEIQIRPGVQHGNQIRLRGRGMPALTGRGIGDLVELGTAAGRERVGQ